MEHHGTSSTHRFNDWIEHLRATYQRKTVQTNNSCINENGYHYLIQETMCTNIPRCFCGKLSA